MSRPAKHPDHEDHGPSSWAAQHSRYAVDDRLRRHGWAIHQRKKGLPVLWTKDGRVLTEAEALEEIRNSIDEVAKR